MEFNVSAIVGVIIFGAGFLCGVWAYHWQVLGRMSAPPAPPPVSLRVKCPHCPLEFTRRGLRNHVRVAHPEHATLGEVS